MGSRVRWSAWRVVVGFGFVSLLTDVVYEGARSVYGPLLATLGASALVVGLVTGAGEAMALVLRLVSGPLADRSGGYWAFALTGYTLTAVSVPLLAVTPFLGAAGVVVAAGLILVERIDADGDGARLAETVGADLPKQFFLFAAAAGTATAGLVTFGVISYRLTTDELVPLAVVPVVYAGAMGVGALAALLSGFLYDRWQGRVLYALPVLVAVVPPLAFSAGLAGAVGGVLIWGAAVGLQDSTVKALVADLVSAPRRATAYGVFAAVQGAAAIAGGALAGALYEDRLGALVTIVAVLQVGTAALLAVTLRRSPDPDTARQP